MHGAECGCKEKPEGIIVGKKRDARTGRAAHKLDNILSFVKPSARGLNLLFCGSVCVLQFLSAKSSQFIMVSLCHPAPDLYMLLFPKITNASSKSNLIRLCYLQRY